MIDLPKYEAYGLLTDLRGFIETLDERMDKIENGWCLQQFRIYAELYCNITQEVATLGIEATMDQFSDDE